MAGKSFKKIRCVHVDQNSVHWIPEHLINAKYLTDNKFIVQDFEEPKEDVLQEAIVEKVVKAPKSKLVNK